MGPFGAVAGGLLGGFLGDMLGGIFGGGGGSDRGSSPANPVHTSDIHSQRLLLEMVNATKVQMLRAAAGGDVDFGMDAGGLQREAILIGAS